MYSNLAFLPIKVDFFNDFNIIEDFPNKFHFWNYKQLLDENNKSTYDLKSWRTDLSTEYDFVKKLVEQLPYDNLSSVRITKQLHPVLQHLDITTPDCPLNIYEDFVKNEPCGYRFVLINKNTFLQFFIKEQWVTANLPDNTYCYLMNTTKLLHRVLSFDNISERITVYVRGNVNKEKHLKNIENNLKLYEKYALYM